MPAVNILINVFLINAMMQLFVNFSRTSMEDSLYFLVFELKWQIDLQLFLTQTRLQSQVSKKLEVE